MADQWFDLERNQFELDLHKCSTAEAREIVDSRINECFRYGVETLRVIFGTPDIWEGSIQEAIEGMLGEDEPLHVAKWQSIHAGVEISLATNSQPQPRDEQMVFRAFSASYQSRHRHMWFERDYYPHRNELSTRDIATNVGCPIEYVRAVAKSLPPDQVELVSEWNDLTRRNETTWRFISSGREVIRSRWQADIGNVREALRGLGATTEECGAVSNALKTPLRGPLSATRRASALLKQLRRIDTKE